MNIEQWFSTPVMYNDLQGELLDRVQSEINLFMPKIESGDLSNPWGDGVKTSFKYNKGEVNDIVKYSFNSLHDEIIKSSYHFLNTFKIFSNPVSLKITDSWTNFSHKGDFQFDHCHQVFDAGTNKCILSGCYYFKTNGEDGDIEFMSPSRADPLFHDLFIQYKPYVGRMLIFPSWLMHRVRINQSDDVRISISFNLEIVR
jgi:uncharacterized protein (TIGR02466 family)